MDCPTVFHVKHRFVLPLNGAWVGPPVLVLALPGRPEEVLDGRARSAEAMQRGLPAGPVLRVHSYIDAIAALIHNGHADRAAEMTAVRMPHLVRSTLTGLERTLGISRAKLVKFQLNLKSPHQRHRLPRRAISVVQRVRKIRARMLEGDAITIDDIDHALGPFTDE